MNENRIAQALGKLFGRHRIVFWYDDRRELGEEFRQLALPGVEKLEIANNEYSLKYRMLRAEPEGQFLVYRDGPQPADMDNWLLDVQLAHGSFRTDQAAIWLAELDLGPEFVEVAQEHAEFFRAQKRKDGLKRMLGPNDSQGAARLKMLALCSGSEARMDAVTENLLQELAEGRDDRISLIGRCGLDRYLWEQMTRCYGYTSDEPGVRDFAVELFKSCYAMGTDGQTRLTGDALVFLKRWKDSRQFEAGFEKLSGECAEVLGVGEDLSRRDFRELMELDYFSLIDRKIMSELVKAVSARTVSADEVSTWVRLRRNGHWYAEYRHLYEAIECAAQFMQLLGETRLDMDSLADALRLYSENWYRLDQLYRKFTWNVRISGQASLTGDLAELIENLYVNNYLLKAGDRFQALVDRAEKWEAPPFTLQRHFFERRIQPFLKRDNKVCVIVSDALRYEIGDELVSLIRQEDRYGAEIEAALSMLPSYTQLGMAALLPNGELEIVGDESGTVKVDGLSSMGTANRMKILDRALPGRATALKADEFMALRGEDCRALVRDHDVIYVYHNRIDAAGDKRESEERVFEAVEETLQDLIRLIKKLAGANANNVLVTADHGFIYQNRAIEESDFSGSEPEAEPEGGAILFRDRRFVLGKALKVASGLRKFAAAQLGLVGDIQVQIPKSIHRLRLKGSGSRYVHGGASLQEVVIPVIRINKKRQSDLARVEVDILRGSSTVITSGQLAVALYQTAPVTDKVQARVLRAGIFTESGDLISDSHDLTFDLSSDNPRDRELQLRFVFTRGADGVNGHEVILRLEERHEGTSHYKEYKSLRYMMRRSFSSDFDF